MDQIFTNFLVLISLLVILSYLCLSFLGLVAYCSVTHPRERDMFRRVLYIPLFLAIGLSIFLVQFFYGGLPIPKQLYLLSGVVLSVLPIGIIYLNCLLNRYRGY